MKVLFVCPFVPWPLENGGKIRTYNLIRSISPLAEIHLRVVREPKHGDDARGALEPWCASLELFDRGRPGPWMRWSRPKLERWFHSPALAARVQEEIETGDFQLVHLDELLLARILPTARDLPIVQHHHKLDTVLYDRLGTGRGPQRFFDLWKLHRLEAESARRYRHHLLCSEQDAEVLRARYGALDCAAIPSGFDPGVFHPSDPPAGRDPSRLLFLGSMDYGPNVDGILHFVEHVLPHILERRPETILEIVGGDPTPAVRALAGDRVLVTGRVPEVTRYLERAAMLVVPLRIGGGTRLKIVEALATGTPVASTKIGAEGLGLEHGRHLLLADSGEALADAVLRLLDDPRTAAGLAEQGRAFVFDRYRWDVLATELLEYWERVAFSGALSPSR